MRLNRFDLNLLVVLDALLTEQNITRAGKQLFLSQSATSGALARLRKSFDDELLIQVGRKMVLTPLGESLVKPVRSLLLQAQATIESRPSFDPGQSDRRFTLIMSDYTTTVLMPKVILAASKVAPDITFESVAPTNSPIEELEQGKADFLLLPSMFLSDQHPQSEIFQDDFVCICCQDNPHIGDSISHEQYLELGHVMVCFGSQRRMSVDSWLAEKAGIKRKAEVIVNTFGTVPHYLPGTLRIATIHRQLAELWSQYLPLKIIPAPLNIPPITWGIQWHQYRDLDPATTWVRELVVNTALSAITPTTP